MNWFIIALKKYAVFSGRSRRSEYWYFTLFFTIIIFGLAMLDEATKTPHFKSGLGLFSTFSLLAFSIPAIAVSVRRLHDTGRSGWWFYFGFIPLVGPLVLIVFYAQNGETEANRFGANPKVESNVKHYSGN